MFSRATCSIAMAMCSVLAVISNCDGVPGQQSRCTLCKGCLRGRHTHPGQWKSVFLLKYSGIPGTSCVCGACEFSVRQGLHGKYKGQYIPRWINKTLKKKSNVAVYQVVAKPPNVIVCLLILIQYVRQQMLV